MRPPKLPTLLDSSRRKRYCSETYILEGNLANQLVAARESSKHSTSWLQGMLAKIEEQIAAGGVDVKDASQCVTSLITSTEGIDGATVALFKGESLTCIASSGMALPKDSVLSSTLGLYAECNSSGR